jgi:hypothetical protein
MAFLMTLFSHRCANFFAGFVLGRSSESQINGQHTTKSAPKIRKIVPNITNPNGVMTQRHNRSQRVVFVGWMNGFLSVAVIRSIR